MPWKLNWFCVNVEQLPDGVNATSGVFIVPGPMRKPPWEEKRLLLVAQRTGSSLTVMILKVHWPMHVGAPSEHIMNMSLETDAMSMTA